MSNELQVLDNYISYVMDTMDKLEAASELVNPASMVTHVEVNTALAYFMKNYLILTSEETRLFHELQEAQKKFDRWFEPILVKTRSKMQSELTKSTKIAKDEVEIQARVDNEEEYYRRKDELDEIKERYDFISCLAHRYAKQENILATLSKNMNSEMHFFGVENRINKSLSIGNVKNGVDGLNNLKVRSRV